MLTCKACQKIIEKVALDETLELCNKCYGISMEALDEILILNKLNKARKIKNDREE